MSETQLKQKKNRLEEFISKNKVYLQGEPYPVGDNYAIDISPTGIKDPQTLDELTIEGEKHGGTYVGVPKPRFLFPKVTLEVPKGYKLLYLHKEDIEAGGPQPRSEISPYDPETQELYENIKAYGQKDPIDVYPSPLGNGKYRVVEGHRRKYVCFDSLYGVFPSGPGMWAICKDRTEQEAYEDALILNEKKLISATEKGHYYITMMEKFPKAYPTLESIGNKVGATDGAIAQVISACRQIDALAPKLDPSILTRVSMLPERVVRPIMSVPESAKYTVVSVVAETGASSRESEHLAKFAKANPDVTVDELKVEVESVRKEKKQEKETKKNRVQSEGVEFVKKSERDVTKLAKSVEELYPESLVRAIYDRFSLSEKKLSDDRMRGFCPIVVGSLVKVARERGFLDEALADAEAWL